MTDIPVTMWLARCVFCNEAIYAPTEAELVEAIDAHVLEVHG